MCANDYVFWAKHPGIVWSNRNASDAIYIRNALLRPKYHQLLEIAVHFGVARLEREWSVLLGHPLEDTTKVRKTVDRILSNIRRGYEASRT